MIEWYLAARRGASTCSGSLYLKVGSTSIATFKISSAISCILLRYPRKTTIFHIFFYIFRFYNASLTFEFNQVYQTVVAPLPKPKQNNKQKSKISSQNWSGGKLLFAGKIVVVRWIIARLERETISFLSI